MSLVGYLLKLLSCLVMKLFGVLSCLLVELSLILLFNRFAHPAGPSGPWFLDSLLLQLMRRLLLYVWLLVIVAWCLVPQYDVQ